MESGHDDGLLGIRSRGAADRARGTGRSTSSLRHHVGVELDLHRRDAASGRRPRGYDVDLGAGDRSHGAWPRGDDQRPRLARSASSAQVRPSSASGPRRANRGRWILRYDRDRLRRARSSWLRSCNAAIARVARADAGRLHALQVAHSRTSRANTPWARSPAVGRAPPPACPCRSPAARRLPRRPRRAGSRLRRRRRSAPPAMARSAADIPATHSWFVQMLRERSSRRDSAPSRSSPATELPRPARHQFILAAGLPACSPCSPPARPPGEASPYRSSRNGHRGRSRRTAARDLIAVPASARRSLGALPGCRPAHRHGRAAGCARARPST